MPAPARTDPIALICAIASIVAGAVVGCFFLYKLLAGTTLPLPLLAMLIMGGAVDVVLGIGILQRRRAAWAFALALHIVAAIVTVIGAPAAARAGLHPVGAAIPPLYTITLVVLLAMSEHDW